MRARALVLLAVVVLLGLAGAACLAPDETGEDALPGWEGSIERQDAVTRVRNPATGAWDGDGAEHLVFELEQVFGVEAQPEETVLGQVGGVAVDDAGNVYVTDRQAHRLVAFAPDGSVRWSVGQQGEGPGDFSQPTNVVWDGDSRLLVSDRLWTEVEIWTTAGEHVGRRELQSVGIASSGYLVGFVAPERLVLVETLDDVLGAGIRVVEAGEQWVSGQGFEVSVEDAPSPQSRGGVQVGVSIVDDRIAVGDIDSYDIRFFDAGGTLSRVVSREASHLPGMAITERAWRPLSHVTAPLGLPDGRWIAVSYGPPDVEDPAAYLTELLQWRPGAGPPPVQRTTVDLFDAEGRLLTSVVRDRPLTEGRFPEMGYPQTVGPEGSFYTSVSDPYPQVRRYRLDIQPRDR